MSHSPWQYLYGPVLSRRLGRSLGIDLVPYKVCTYDCVYCQLGYTATHTLQRDEYVDTTQVLSEVEAWLAGDGQADYLTFSGSGEPTLHSRIGEMIVAVRAMTDIPVAVLTNGSLLWQSQLREQVCTADLLVPSLDAATPAAFAKVNRPASGLSLDQVIAGLQATKNQAIGEMWLEVMLVAGYNDSIEQLEALRVAIDAIKPDRVQINTVVRPPAEATAQPLSAEALQQAQQILGPSAEVIAPLDAAELMMAERQHTEAEVLELLRRRPCTLDDIAAGLGMHRNEALKYIDTLLSRVEIMTAQRNSTTFYLPSGGS